MTEEEARKKVQEDPGFIFSKRYEYSIDQLESRYPDGCPDNIIAHALMIGEESVEAEFNKIVIKMRTIMGVEL